MFFFLQLEGFNKIKKFNGLWHVFKGEMHHPLNQIENWVHNFIITKYKCSHIKSSQYKLNYLKQKKKKKKKKGKQKEKKIKH